MPKETKERKAYRLNYYAENKDRLRVMSRKHYYLKRYGLDKGIPKKRYYNTTRGTQVSCMIIKKEVILTFD